MRQTGIVNVWKAFRRGDGAKLHILSLIHISLYTKDRTILLRMFDYQTEKYTVCKDTTTIGKMAFSGFINLKKLVLSDKLQEIQTKAFERCSNLEEIIGIENVPNIADDALESTPYYKKRTVIFSKSAIQKYGLVTERVYAIPDLSLIHISSGSPSRDWSRRTTKSAACRMAITAATIR